MFGGVGLMESPSRTLPACLIDSSGAYKADGDSGGINPSYKWNQTANDVPWLAAKDWDLFKSLCDLWSVFSSFSAIFQ